MTKQEQKETVEGRQRCSESFMVAVNDVSNTIKVVPLYCHRWTCPRCRRAKANYWKDVAKRGNPERFITLTLRQTDKVGPRVQAAQIKQSFSRLVQKLRRDGKRFQYLLMFELTKKDTPHVHILQRGDFIPKGQLSDLWKELTGSYIVDIKKVKNTGSVVGYITKYMGKQISECAEKLEGMRVVQKSRDWECEPNIGEEPDEDHDPGSYTDFYFVKGELIDLYHFMVENLDWEVSQYQEDSAMFFNGPEDKNIIEKILYFFGGEKAVQSDKKTIDPELKEICDKLAREAERKKRYKDVIDESCADCTGSASEDQPELWDLNPPF